MEELLAPSLDPLSSGHSPPDFRRRPQSVPYVFWSRPAVHCD